MKNIVLFFVAALLFPVSSYSGEYLGAYTTVPEKFLGFHKPYSEKIKKAIEKMTWKMEITKAHISITMESGTEEIQMEYEAEGNYLRAVNNESNVGSYVPYYIPFYIKNSQEIHGMGTVFFREE